MTNDPSPNRSKENPFSNPTIMVALIGGLCTLVGAIITVTPQLILLLNRPTETPVPTLAATLPVLPTSELTLTPTVMLPTDTATATETQIPPTPTETIPPSPTPVDPGIACLDRWQVISSNPGLIEPASSGTCAQASIPDLGISASSAGINFGINNFREQGTFGIATSLPADATISLQVDYLVLTQGEFWIALSNSPSPDNNMMILALQPKTGEVRIYNNRTNRHEYATKYSDLLENTSLSPGVLPYTYNITFTISGNRVSTKIHSTNLPDQSVNLPNYLFIGYNFKSTVGSLQTQVDVRNLSVEVK
jgi:hypothetical protein